MLAVPTSLTPPVARSLTAALRRIEEDDDITAVSATWRPGSRRRSGRTRPASLGQALSGRGGRGLFGNSEVWVTETPSRSAAAVLGAEPRAAAPAARGGREEGCA